MSLSANLLSILYQIFKTLLKQKSTFFVGKYSFVLKGVFYNITFSVFNKRPLVETYRTIATPV